LVSSSLSFSFSLGVVVPSTSPIELMDKQYKLMEKIITQ